MISVRTTRQRGFTMVTGIFLLALMAILSVFIIGLGIFQSKATSLDVAGARAYQAAAAGVQAGVYNSLRNNTCGGQTLTFTGVMVNFKAVVTCSRSTHIEGATTINVDTISATACNQPTCPDVSGAPPSTYVERKLTAVVENP